MTEYEDYITGLHDDNSPMNRKEGLSEIEECTIIKDNLETKLALANSRNRYLASLLKEAGGIFELYRMTNNITEKELNRLNEIFEPYLTN